MWNPAGPPAPSEARTHRGLLSTLARPSTWIALTVLLLPLGSSGGPEPTQATPSDLAIVVASVLAARVVVGGGQLAVVRSIPALGFLLLGVASVSVALLAPGFPENIVGAARFLQLFLLAPFAVMVSLRTRRDAIVVISSVVVLALAEGALGLYQFLTGTGAGIGGEAIRAVGTFGAYNIGALAELCAVALLICLAVAVVGRGQVRWTAAAGAVFLALPLLASMTRGVWVGTAVAAVVVVSRARPARLLAVLAAAVAVAAATVPALVGSGSDLGRRIQSLLSTQTAPDQSLIDRLALWDAAFAMALDHPLTGVGPRAFAEHRDAYADLSLLGSSDIAFGSEFQQVALESPHNFYLLIASEQGLIVMLLYVTVLVTLLARGLVRAARRRSDLSTLLALVGAGLLAYQLVAMLTGDLGGPGSLLVALCIGLAGWAAADIDLESAREAGARLVQLSPSPAPVGVA